ncbi:TonB-dependent siderophore receptor [Novosphingobium sp. Gsoil 351]|uniref:TonB-dependent receptor plug domain-containing protein n=1 Tax=Novosphingobium sp. Gsoil 351 TaxID=2675225 RepID=UPI0012B48E86|nr:TonB-dependent receptor [Novosphingobium sp. Gsoil 351]QGN54989.1 TonB-dependent receptor [Novosphingobium sp. Gsoil 351]
MNLRNILSTGGAIGAIALSLGVSPAQAQDTSAQAAEETAPPESAIIVTGSRSTTRTVANSPVPVDVLSGETLTEGGQVETNKILNKLVPSFNFPQPAISDGSDALRPATLRGLAPDQTLVLVNGKRRHTAALLNINGTVGRGSAAVDMNSIPALAIERIEVLRDGASSQYGSDAIAGVINIRLKTADSGGKAVVSYGKYVTTLDDVLRVTGLQTNAAGQPFFDPTDGRYLAANTGGELKVRDGETYTFASNVGLPIFGEGGYLNLTAEYRHRDRTNRTGFDLRPNYVRPSGTTFDPRELTFDRREFRFGDPEADDFTLFLNSAIPLGDVFELYAFASFNQRDSVSAANYRQQSNANNVDYSQLAPNQPPPAVGRPLLTPDGFLPLIKSDLTDYAYTAGIRGEIMGFRSDLSVGIGSNQFDYVTQNSVNASFGAATQGKFDAGGLRYTQGLLNLDLSRDYELGFAKPLTVSFGGEYRNERYQIRPGDFQSYALGPFFRAAVPNTTLANCTALGGRYGSIAATTCDFPGRNGGAGAQGFAGLPANARTDAVRHNFAGYAEVDTDPFDGLSLTAAARFEHYSDFGNTVTGKLAARFEVVDGFALRGSVSNGFRAPSLHQQVFTTTSTNFISGIPIDILTVPVSNPVARALGSKDLKAEKSLNLSAGFTANPLSGLTLTVDYYNIRIRNRIVLTENLGASGSGTSAQNAAVGALLAAAGYPSLGAARFFVNGLDTRTQGVDAVLNWRVPVDFGKFNLTAAYNYNDQKILKYRNSLAGLSAIPGLVLFGRTESLRFTKGQPRDKIVLSADGDIGAFGFTVRGTRYGKVLSPGSIAPLAPNQLSLTALGPDDIKLSPKWITDIEVRFDVSERIHLAVGADNAFDVYPDRLPFGPRPAAAGGGFYPQNNQYNGYSIFSPFGFNGRFLYGRVGFDF